MIQVVNLPAVLAGLTRIQVGLKTGEQAVENGGARIVARLAQGFAPKQTGFHASQIRAQGSEVVAGADYAGYQEHGTSFHGAQPALQPARAAGEPAIFALGTKVFTAVTR